MGLSDLVVPEMSQFKSFIQQQTFCKHSNPTKSATQMELKMETIEIL
jgi:hypothetical protein